MNAHVRSDFLRQLRRETASAHEQLERDLGLAEGRISEARIRNLLERFYGFYRTWEPWIDSSGIEAGFFAPRRKLALVERDLRALGGSNLSRLPAFAPQIGPATEVWAVGSLYVIEGSTLGGQIIGRWLRDASWLPPGGLAYFNSYGADVGRMWRSFQERLERVAATSSHEELIQAASATFCRLRLWLCEDKETA